MYYFIRQREKQTKSVLWVDGPPKYRVSRSGLLCARVCVCFLSGGKNDPMAQWMPHWMHLPTHLGHIQHKVLCNADFVSLFLWCRLITQKLQKEFIHTIASCQLIQVTPHAYHMYTTWVTHALTLLFCFTVTDVDWLPWSCRGSSSTTSLCVSLMKLTPHAYHMHTTFMTHLHHMAITCTPHGWHMYTTWVSHVHHMPITCSLLVILFYWCRLITLKLQRVFIHDIASCQLMNKEWNPRIKSGSTCCCCWTIWDNIIQGEHPTMEPPDKKWQYLLFAAEPYETISFKVSTPPWNPLIRSDSICRLLLNHMRKCHSRWAPPPHGTPW